MNMKLTDKFENYPGIYILTNIINNKQYVGETVNIKTRMKGHKRSSSQTIHSAIKKYGIDKFDVYVEYFPNFIKKDLQILEEQLILRCNSLVPNGYNVLIKGESSIGFKHSEECKLRMSLLKKGKKLSEEHKENLSKSRIGRKHSHHAKLKMRNSQLGNKHSEETKLKMSLTRKGKAPSEQCILASIKFHTGRKTSDETKSKISQSNKGKTKRKCLYKRNASDETKRKMSESKKGKRPHDNVLKALKIASENNKKPIIQMDRDTLDVIKVWPSAAEAASDINGNIRMSTSITSCLKGKQKTALGFKWEYFNK